LQVIVDKMVDYLRTTNDEVTKTEVVKRIGELAERFAPDTQWFLDTMNQVHITNMLVSLLVIAMLHNIQMGCGQLLYKLCQQSTNMWLCASAAWVQVTTTTHTSGMLPSKGVKSSLMIISQVFELGGDVVSPQLANSLMRLIAEGAGEEDDQADTELRAQAVCSYLDLLDKPKLSAVLLKVCLQTDLDSPCCVVKQQINIFELCAYWMCKCL